MMLRDFPCYFGLHVYFWVASRCTKIQWKLSRMTTLDVKRSGLSRHVKFVWNPMVHGTFHKVYGHCYTNMAWCWLLRDFPCYSWHLLCCFVSQYNHIHSNSSALSVSNTLIWCIMMDSKSGLKSMHFLYKNRRFHHFWCAKSLMIKRVGVWH